MSTLKLEQVLTLIKRVPAIDCEVLVASDCDNRGQVQLRIGVGRYVADG